MDLRLDFTITPQPNETTCGPACLHSVYAYYGEPLPESQIISEVRQWKAGGTLTVLLALHALQRGYRATIYTCNLRMFDPSWFGPDAPDLRERLVAQSRVKRSPRLRAASRWYVEFLDAGGEVFMEDLTERLIADILRRGWPIITALSATWLYRCPRERPGDSQPDDVAGEPVGHFVVVHGVNLENDKVAIADPYAHEPFGGRGGEAPRHYYEVDVNRLVDAILLGIVTFDAKLLVIRPPSAS